jgi:autotransporter-associated beta strand protein
MKLNPLYPSRLAACILPGLLFVTASLHATTYTWVPSIGGNWDTITANWNDGVTNPTTWVDGGGNSVVFNGFAAGVTVAQSANWTMSSLTLKNTGGIGTLIINGGKSIDVPAISTIGDSPIDMFSKITGSHGLTFDATTASGRLNLKAANDYTGDTFLTGSAYVTSAINNAMPTGTTLNMATGTTLRFATNNVTQEIAGLVGTGTALVTATSTGNTLTITTKSGVTTTHSGNITSATGLNLTIQGSGTQALNGGTMTFTGATTVSGGTLSLGNNLSNTSSVVVSGGTLSSSVANANLGVGGVTLSTGGTIDPRGSASGTFTLAANQNFTATGGSINFNIGTATDQIKGSGTGIFNLSNTSLALTLGSGFSYANTYTVFSGFSGSSIVGTGVSISGYDTTNWLASLSNTGVLSFAASSVPEPSTYAALTGAAVLGFVALRRRRVAC